MSKTLDNLRLALMFVGAVATGLLGAMPILALLVSAFTITSAIGLYALTHREG